MITYTNQETNKSMTVFVHEVIERHGKKVAVVNKGKTKTMFTFVVPVSQTNLVIA